MSMLKKIGYEIFDFLSFTLFIVGIVLFIRFFIINPFTVMGESMETTFHTGDFILVNKRRRFVSQEFARGDVVVLIPPVSQGTPFIKRIIGLPGETVILENKTVIIEQPDGSREILDETYLDDTISTTPKCGGSRFVVPADEFFVMGDNRDRSTDSRCCFDVTCLGNMKATIHRDNIVGLVNARIFPRFSLGHNW